MCTPDMHVANACAHVHMYAVRRSHVRIQTEPRLLSGVFADGESADPSKRLRLSARGEAEPSDSATIGSAAAVEAEPSGSATTGSAAAVSAWYAAMRAEDDDGDTICARTPQYAHHDQG